MTDVKRTSHAPGASRSTPFNTEAAAPAVRTGTFAGRQVVPGTLAITHCTTGRDVVRCLAIFCGVIAGGSALLATPAVGDVYAGESDDLPMSWSNTASTAVATLGGAALPYLVASGIDSFRRWLDTRALHKQGADHVAQRRSIVIESTAWPLTDKGLKARVELLREVGQAHRVSAGEVALSIAQLGAGVPTEHDPCLPCEGPDVAQFTKLVAAIARDDLSHREFRAALIQLASSLRHPTRAGYHQPRVFANILMRAYDASLAHREGKTEATPLLWERTPLLVGLRASPYFADHSAIVDGIASVALGCNEAAYKAERPVRDGKGNLPPSTGPNRMSESQFLVGDWAWRNPQSEADALDGVMTELCRTPFRDSQDTRLAQHLRAQAVRDDALGRARGRASFLLDHLVDAHERPAVALSERDWVSAPCALLEALTYLQTRSPGNAALSTVTQRVATPQAVSAAINRASIAELNDEVNAALRIAHSCKGTSMHAEHLVAILQALGQRRDLPEGAFMEGLMSASDVSDVITRLTEVTDVSVARRRTWIAELPKLCQLRADLGVLEAANLALAALDGGPPDDATARASTAVNERISQADDTPTALLHHPWLDAPTVTIHVRTEPPARADHINDKPTNDGHEHAGRPWSRPATSARA